MICREHHVPMCVIPTLNKMHNSIRMRKTAIFTFSIIGILLGLSSIGLQIASLVIDITVIGMYGYELVGAGIWGGVFYIIAGSLGWAAASKRSKSLLIVTVVFSAISMVASFVAAILNRLDTYYLDYNYDDLCPLPLSNYYYCDTYAGLEWAMMGVSIAAFISNADLLVLTSIAVCCAAGGPIIKNKSSTVVIVHQQAGIDGQ